MNEKERNQMINGLRRGFATGNRQWIFNGRSFETSMQLYRANVSLGAYFESKGNEVTVWIRLDRAFREDMDINSPRKKFVGDDCMIEALNWLAEVYEVVIDNVKEREWELLNSRRFEFAKAELQDIFDKIIA